MNNDRRNLIILVLVLGSIWGFLEVVLGGAMKAASIPYKGDVLTGLGIGLMAVLLALWRKPAALLAVAVLAVAVKQLAVPILHMPVFCGANSCLAVGLAGGALAGTSSIAGGRLGRGVAPRIATGVSAALLASTGFYIIGMHVAPCKYLLSFNRAGGYVSFMAAEGLIWAALAGVLFPAGYRLGEHLGAALDGARTRRPAAYFATLGTIAALAWIASGIAIAAGL
jgi:hypothetical protein